MVKYTMFGREDKNSPWITLTVSFIIESHTGVMVVDSDTQEYWNNKYLELKHTYDEVEGFETLRD